MNQVRNINTSITFGLTFGSTFCFVSDNAFNSLYESNTPPNPLTYPVYLDLYSYQHPKTGEAKAQFPLWITFSVNVTHWHTPAG